MGDTPKPSKRPPQFSDRCWKCGQLCRELVRVNGHTLCSSQCWWQYVADRKKAGS